MRRSICDFRLKQKDIQQMHSAEVAVAKAQAAADEKRKVETEVAEIKKYKSFLERNEEVYKLAIAVVAKALKNGNLNAAAMGLAQANAATGQIKPTAPTDSDKSEPKESGFLKGYMAKAEAFYGNQQTGVPVDTTKRKARANPLLVDPGKPL